MPRYDEHFETAAIVSALARAGLELHRNPRIPPVELVLKSAFSAIVGGVGGVLPDLIEPGNNPNHRGAGHSVGMGALLAYLHREIWANPTIDPGFKQFIADLVFGYVSHLALDAGTPRGLPLIMRNL